MRSYFTNYIQRLFFHENALLNCLFKCEYSTQLPSIVSYIILIPIPEKLYIITVMILKMLLNHKTI